MHVICEAQEANRYNLNINNGLPSNHIYFMIKDRHGYLWMATTNGVVRYNGYECKVFNLSNGLPTTDVWSLFEDKVGRIWLGDISDELGYIYHNEYHKANVKQRINSFYPSSINNYKDGVIFSNGNSLNTTHYICITNHDSIQIAGPQIRVDTSIFVSLRGGPFFLNKDSLYSGVIKDNSVTLHGLFRVSDSIFRETRFGPGNTTIMNDHLLHYVPMSNSVLAINVHSGANEKIRLSDYTGISDTIYLMAIKETYNDRSYMNFIQGHNITQFKDDTTFKFIRSYPIRSLVNDSNINGNKVTSFLDDTLWGSSLATSSNGLYINYNSNNNIISKSNIDLTNYHYAGKVTDNETYWWNRSASTLAKFENNGHMVTREYPINGDVNCIIPYNEDTCLIFFSGSINSYWYMLKSGTMVRASTIFGGDIISAIVYGHDNVFTASKEGFSKIQLNNNDITRFFFDNDRYKGLVYDSIRQNLLAWNNGKVFIHFHNGKDTIISKDGLIRLGVKQMEKIIIDNTYGNIFFKSNEKLVMYNYEKGTYTQLFEQYNFIGASIDIYNHTIVAAGAFGVLFSKIIGIQNLSAPIVYNNVKNNYYNYVSDMQLANHEVLLNTDRGTFKVAMPADTAILHNKPGVFDAYKLIINYMDTTIDVVSGDTLKINQKNPVLAFDFINPMGNGKLRYSYCMSVGDTQWHELNESELNLPRLEAGEYISLTIVAYDDVFRSKKMMLHLYTIPYWWQTTTGRIGVVLTLLLLLAIAILVTRRIVLFNARKRNLRMEMELKSMYAQINPHFIFNSLNSAMYMVSSNKMDEAHSHIAKFSNLLRSYLKSSRNRYITIADEVANLRDYIELQQERFDNKFEYTVHVADTIEMGQVEIPSLLLQPFVENAINHGLRHSEKNGHLDIEFKKGPKAYSIICVITDDGIGRKQSKQIVNLGNRVSYGNDLIKGLVRIFNTYEKMSIEIKYTDMEEPETGTRVEVIINNMAHGT